MKLIGLAGKARSGKDTVAHMWAEERQSKRYALANPIRAVAAEMFNLPVGMFSGDNPDREEVNEFWGISPRRMLQLIGTESGREVFGPDLWLKHAEQVLTNQINTINQAQPTPVEYFIITDIRFDNEAEWIRRHKGTVVHVERPEQSSIVAHKSEAGVSKKLEDKTICNYSSLTDLKERLIAAIKLIEL